MPPKVKVTKEEVIKSTLELVKTNGAQAINARAIASALNCSTQPIFSNFSTMKELEKSVITSSYECYRRFIKDEVEAGKYPKYKSYGMAYLRFAREEKELFKLLFMRDRTGEDTSKSPDFEESVQMIVELCGLTTEKAWLMHMEMWSCVHGIGAMLATSFLSIESDLISDMLTDIYQGLLARHLSKESK